MRTEFKKGDLVWSVVANNDRNMWGIIVAKVVRDTLDLKMFGTQSETFKVWWRDGTLGKRVSDFDLVKVKDES
tara:strand:+ start:1571 stop:1789 length:219 start_codon:yes stop_codon:yes gene_type:complete